MTAPNAALAYRVLDHIDAHPESWNQAKWWCGTSGCFAGWTVQLSGEKVSGQNFVRVGPGELDVVHIGERAAQLLGFEGTMALDDVAWNALGMTDEDETDEDETVRDEFELFSAVNTREDLGRIVEAVFGPRPASGVVIVDHGPVRPPYGTPEREAYDREHSAGGAS